MSDVKMEDMPQLPETQGFQEIFREMLRFDRISQEWVVGLSHADIIVLTFMVCHIIVGAIVYFDLFQRIHDYFNHEETFGERMKKALGFKQD